MNAIVICSGDELIEGRVADTNGAFLARTLTDLGAAVLGVRMVGDDLDELVRELSDAAARADLIAVTGGLGGTKDDITREAIAKAFGRPLERREEAAANLVRFWKRLGRELPPEPWPEAMAPRGSIILDNAVGIAPGLVLAVDEPKTVVFAFPGVPAELERIVADGAFRGSGDPGTARADVGLVGLRESAAAALLGERLARGRNPLIGIGAKDGTLVLHIRAKAADPAAARAMLEVDLSAIEAAMGAHVFTTSGESIGAAVVRELSARSATLAVAESLTGGYAAHCITETPGASKVFLGGATVYTEAAKMSLAAVPKDLLERFGAVSEETAIAMALGIRERLGSTYGVATTGIAGPDGGTDRSPVGTVFVAVADRDGVRAEKRLHPGSRSSIKKKAAVHALDLLLRRLKGPRA